MLGFIAIAFLCLGTRAIEARSTEASRATLNSEDMANRLRYTVNENEPQPSNGNRLTAILPSTPFIRRLGRDQSKRVVRLRRGDSLSLECEVVGMPTPVSYWRKVAASSAIDISDKPPTNNVLELVNNNGRPSLETSITIAKLAFGCLSPGDAGVYQCVGDNGVVKVISETRVIIEGVAEDEITNGNQCQSITPEQSPPTIIMRTDMRMEYLGNDAQLNCRADGQPTPIVRWYDSDDLLVQSGNNYTLLPNGDLLLKRVNFGVNQPFRQFTCRASNDFGSDSAVIGLLIMKPSDK